MTDGLYLNSKELKNVKLNWKAKCCVCGAMLSQSEIVLVVYRKQTDHSCLSCKETLSLPVARDETVDRRTESSRKRAEQRALDYKTNWLIQRIAELERILEQ